MSLQMIPERVAQVREWADKVEKVLSETQVHTAVAVCLSLSARYLAWMLTDDKLVLPDDFLPNTFAEFITTIEANIELLKTNGGRVS